MTEAEWLACEDPKPMLAFLRDRGSERKLRLFAVACCRRIWDLFEEESSGKAVEVAERFADGRAKRRDCIRAAAALEEHTDDCPSARAARNAVDIEYQRPEDPECPNAFLCATDAAEEAAEERSIFWESEPADGADALTSERNCFLRERAAQASLLREIFGNPIRPITLDRRGATRDAVALAEAVYDVRDLPSGHLDAIRLAILADAMEEAAAASEIVAHLRSPGPHVRGCWVLDLVMGKK